MLTSDIVNIVTGVDLSDFDIRYGLVVLVGLLSSSSHGRKIALPCQRSYGCFFPKGNEIYEIPWQILWGRCEAFTESRIS